MEFHHTDFSWPTKAGIAAAAGLLLWSLAVLPQGQNPDGLWGKESHDAETGEYVFVHDPVPVFAWALVLGFVTAYLLLLSLLLAYRYPVGLFVPARWRTRIHVASGILVLVTAAAHGIVLVSIRAFESWPSGLASFVVLASHGLAGARKTWFVEHLGARRWRTLHAGSAWLGFAIGLLHSLVL